MVKYTADVSLRMSVEFEDNGTDDLKTQAYETLQANTGLWADCDVDIGSIKPVETPSA